MRLPMFSS